MLHLASQEFTGRRVLLVEKDLTCIAEMTAAVEASGGIIADTVTNGFAAISYVKMKKVDAVVVHTDTLQRVPFDLHEVLMSLGVGVMPVTSFDDWYDADEDDVEDQPMVYAEVAIAA